jgi:hypothetical protein
MSARIAFVGPWLTVTLVCWSVFGMRARVVLMQLGEQQLELIEFLSPPGVELP